MTKFFQRLNYTKLSSLVSWFCKESVMYSVANVAGGTWDRGEGDGTPLHWKIPWTEEPGGLQSMGLLRVRHDWATSLALFTFTHWRRKWQPTPCLQNPRDRGAWWAAFYGVAQSQTWLKRLSSSSSMRLSSLRAKELHRIRGCLFSKSSLCLYCMFTGCKKRSRICSLIVFLSKEMSSIS